MASGLQCPGCGHVHPAGLPEIVRGDATFRCYGCYRTLSIPEGWTGRPSPRPAPTSVPTKDAPPGAGLRDARASRLAGRRRGRPSGAGFDDPTQSISMRGPEDGGPGPVDPPGRRGVGGPGPSAPEWSAAGTGGPGSSGRDWSAAGTGASSGGGRADPDAGGHGSSGRDWYAAGGGGTGTTSPVRDWSDATVGSPAPNWPAAGATGTWAGAAGSAAPGSAGVAGARTPAGASTGSLAGARPGAAGSTGGLAGAYGPTAGPAAAPLGWIAPRRSNRPVPPPVRALVWAAAFGVSLLLTAYVLRKVGVLDVNTAIDLFAGSGPGRFGFLVVMLPLWALLSATIAHFSLEALARRRRPPARRGLTPVASGREDGPHGHHVGY